ncbi:MAG: methyltransferase [Deltaproteobacteria bacterium]|nr:methyltransferase [Deltaproteobacteria bacterium]
MSENPIQVLPENQKVLGQFLALQPVALCPEIRLWLVAGHVDLNARCQELMQGGYAPYWAFCWGAGQALARYILDHPDEVSGKRVVDFGAGSGVAAIAAARAGAREVVAVDTDPQAREFISLNALINRVAIAVTSELPDEWDLILVADVLYELHDPRRLFAFADRGREVLVSDPQRPGNPRLAIPPLAQMQVRTQPDVDYPMCQASIFRIATADNQSFTVASQKVVAK